MPPKLDAKEQEIIAGYKMIEGDYTVQIRILEANDLVPTYIHFLKYSIGGFGPFKSKGSSCDAMVQVECNGKRKRTKVKKGQLSPVFNQMFTYKLEGMKKQQLKDAVVVLTAYDKRTFAFKNPIIGQYELDLSSVYFAINHEFYRTWLTLSDPTDEREGVMGYLLVNIAVLGPNDEPVIHTVSTEKKADAPKEQSLVPQKIKQFAHSVNVRLFKGEHMVPLDVISADIDAYVQVKYAGVHIRSDVVRSRNPNWFQELNLGCMLPNQSKFINFEVFDRDLIRSDDMVGCFKVAFRDVYLREDLPPTWSNIYGPPIYGKGNHADLMTLYGSDYGSHYRGRILYQIASYDERDSKTFRRSLKYKFPDNPLPNSEQKSYILRVDLIEGHEFPTRTKGFIHVMMGPYQLVSKEVPYVDGTLYFYEQLTDKKVLFPTDIAQVPDIIFYFADDFLQDRRHTFYRIKAADILDQPRTPKVIKMKEDRSLALVKDDEFPGFLYANVQLMSVNPGPRKAFQPIQSEKVEYELRVYLFLGRNLPPADSTGTSDPFVKVRCGGQLAQSKTCQQTLNPGWYETLVMNIKLFPLEQPCVVPGGMFVMVFDDDGDGKASLIGRVWITLEPNLIAFQSAPDQPTVDVFYRKPKWYNIIYDATDEVQGQLLLSYALIRKADAQHVPMENIYPTSSKATMHFFCIGLRNIDEHVDGIDPSTCSVSFDVSGDDADAFFTDPMKVKAGGININRLVSLSLDVPNNQNFCPVLDVFVWEETPGKPKTLLGTTTIQLSQILSNYYKRRKLPPGAIMEEDSEDEEQELIDQIEAERTRNANLIKGAELAAKPEGEGLNEEDLDHIDLAVPWELPIKRKLMEDDDYQRKMQEIQAEHARIAQIVQEEEVKLQAELQDEDQENPVYGQTIFQIRQQDGMPEFYPQQWGGLKQLPGGQPQPARAANPNLPNHYPSQWGQFKQISPKVVEDQAVTLHQLLGRDEANPLLDHQAIDMESSSSENGSHSNSDQSDHRRSRDMRYNPDQISGRFGDETPLAPSYDQRSQNQASQVDASQRQKQSQQPSVQDVERSVKQISIFEQGSQKQESIKQASQPSQKPGDQASQQLPSQNKFGDVENQFNEQGNERQASLSQKQEQASYKPPSGKLPSEMGTAKQQSRKSIFQQDPLLVQFSDNRVQDPFVVSENVEGQQRLDGYSDPRIQLAPPMDDEEIPVAEDDFNAAQVQQSHPSLQPSQQFQPSQPSQQFQPSLPPQQFQPAQQSQPSRSHHSLPPSRNEGSHNTIRDQASRRIIIEQPPQRPTNQQILPSIPPQTPERDFSHRPSVHSNNVHQPSISSHRRPSQLSNGVRQPSVANTVFQQRPSANDQRVAFENERRPSQVQLDLRSRGSRASIRNAVGIDQAVLVNPEQHYKNSERNSVIIDGPMDGQMHGSIKALSEKSKRSLMGKPVPDNVSQRSAGSIKSVRLGSQVHLPYSQQLDPDAQSAKSAAFGLKSALPPINTLQVGSQMSFSAASKVSSHALSLASVGKDNMDAKPSGNEHKPPRKKKNFGDRMRGRFNIFGFNVKKAKRNDTQVETYEEYDTDPDEDLSIVPPWLRDRPFFPDDLEDFIKPSRKFMKFVLKRGQVRGSKSLFQTEKQAEPEEVCTLKCIFLEERPGQDIEAKRELYQKLMKPKQYICRLYILEGVNIQTESEEPPDLFLKIKVAGADYDLQKATLKMGSINPQFYIAYEVPCEIPGSSFVRIELYQKNTFDSELIGFTEIDLEDRYFAIMWHRYDMKPLESRNLKNDFGASVGRLQLWIDLVEKSLAKQNPVIKIEAPPRYEFELRTIVWETRNCIFKDELAKCNDLFARGGPASQDFQETDTHWRCRAKGSFNWRMKYKSNFPMLPEEYGADQFKIQLWDKDIIGSNELIGETQLALNTHKMIDKAVKRRSTVKMMQRIRELGGQITDRFWLEVFHPDAVDDEGKKIPQGQVCVSFELMPMLEVPKFPNGLGRDAPNNFPPLPEPTGRLSFDLANPLQFIKDIMGPDLYSKLCRTIAGCACFAFLIFFGWFFFTQIISGLIVR